ncbi:MAG: ABC transporter substrate-binding protein [Clostridiales Family XIII bacterium]|jgi:ABC-type nitrate/sulfonate/bicarbonate transport system substrate-binding protein|nr:ABC transporter substrate-binding protein [Clostridiales Family XIII bacterium]
MKKNMKTNMKKKNITRCLSIGLMAALLGLTTACGGTGGSSSDGGNAGSGETGEESYVLKWASIGTNPTSVDAVSIGVYKGFFAEAGIEFEDVGEVAIPQFVPALLSGGVTGATLMTSNGIAAIDSGGEIIEVAVNSYTTKELPHMVFVTAENSPVKNGKDLEGKRVGVPAIDGCTAGFPIEYAAQAGVEDPNAAIQFVVMPDTSLIESLRKGDIDVAGLHLPPAVVEKLYPDTEILFTDYDILDNRGGDISYYFPKSYIEENEEAVRRFIGAIAKTNNWINENTEEAVRIYREEINPNANADLLYAAHFAEDALIEESHTDLWIDILSAGGSIQPLENEWTFEQVATNEYNPNYVK